MTLLFVIANALILKHVLTDEQVPQQIASAILSAGLGPIMFLIVVNMEIGMITPPVGLNLFVTSGVAGMPMMRVVRAAQPFLGVLFVFLIIVTYVPWISTFLPNTFMGPEIIIN